MWRCINNHPFGYCNGTPDWQKEPEEVKDSKGLLLGIIGGTCKLDYKICGKYLANLPDHPELTKTNTIISEKPKKEISKTEKKPKQHALFGEEDNG